MSGNDSRGRLALLALVVLLLAPAASLAQIEDLCHRAAARYDKLVSLKRLVTPERVSSAYVETFTIKGADRDGQAVWRRMKGQGLPLEKAIEDHVRRHHGDLEPSQRDELKRRIAEQVKTMTLIKDLVLAFETFAITPEFVEQVSEEEWRKQKLAPERYSAMMRSKASEYRKAGFNPEQATVRAAVEVRAAIDRDRGAPRSLIIDKGHVCYKDELGKFELYLRHKGLTRRMGALTESERAQLPERIRRNADNISRLTYYTHMKFGPRDYSQHRLSAWEIAAEGDGAKR